MEQRSWNDQERKGDYPAIKNDAPAFWHFGIYKASGVPGAQRRAAADRPVDDLGRPSSPHVSRIIAGPVNALLKTRFPA
jgi:hypothetical protein